MFENNRPSAQAFDTLENAEVVQPKQRTPEWFAARRGRFTGSEIHKLMSDPRSKADKDAGRLSDGAMTYIFQVLAEKTTGITPEITTASMQWGIDHEDEAKRLYESLYGESIAESDFVSWGEYGGGSTDGEIGTDGIAEVKCPYTSGTHLSNLAFAAGNPDMIAFKDEYKEYYWQIQNNLMVTGRAFCRFISYDPRFSGMARMSVVTIERNEDDIAELESMIQRAAEVMNKIKEQAKL